MFRTYPYPGNSESDSGSTQAIDVRKSKFKKVSGVLKYYAKEKLFTISDKAGVISILSVQRTHDLFKGVKVDNPDDFKAVVAQRSANTNSSSTGDDGNQASSSSSSSSSKDDKKIAVLDLYKLTKQLKDVFGSIKGLHGEYLTSHEVSGYTVLANAHFDHF